MRRISANICEVQSADGVHRCTFRKKLKLGGRRSLKLAAVGDEVEFTPAPDQEGEIERVLPRRSKLSRHDVLRPTREQVIVANVDNLLIIQAAAEPMIDAQQIDRGLVMAGVGGLEPTVVINKVDLVPPEMLDEILDPYRDIGVPVLLISAKAGTGLEGIRGVLKDRLSVLVGPSGVGKSTLLNALAPGLDLKTKDVSRKTSEGTHTTSWVELLEVAGGRVADTPGIEFFTLWGLDDKNLADFFPEFEGIECRFADCTHTVEPGCGGHAKIDPGRLESYAAMLQELRDRPKTYRREGRRRIRRRYEEAEEE